MNAVSSAAAHYVERGFAVLPLKPSSKVPATRNGKNDATADATQVAAWFPPDTKRNVGILTGGQSRLIVVDVDPRNGGFAGFERLERTYGRLPETLRATTGGGGLHLYFSVPEGTEGLSDRPNVANFAGVDLKAGGYVVAAPSIHESGRKYVWENEGPIAEAPAWLVDLARGGKRIQEARQPNNSTIQEGARNDALFRLASGLRSRGLSAEAIGAALRAENEARCVPPLDTGEVQRIVTSALRYEPGSDHAATELGNARRLVELMNGNARYEPASRDWFVWDGRHWERDHDGTIIRLAKQVVDDLLSTARLTNDPETLKRRVAFAHKSQSAPRIAGMVQLATSEPGLPIRFDTFDRDAHLLNVKNGMIDLRTGDLLPHRRDAFSTHMIDIEYHDHARGAVFEQFVADILGHDLSLIDYVQTAVGYGATAETSEQCFFVLHGEGANGKSTFLNAIRLVLGSYAKHTPTETLVSKTSGSSNDLARLAGSRFLTASEANADQRLASALLKQITGDEPVVARFLFKEFISFRPTFKLFLATNQLPQMNGSDPAMWRRIRTVPFNRVFALEEQDRDLMKKLAAEREGILAWIVRGAVNWYSYGLQTPAAVEHANSEYRADMDSVGQFLEERCELSPAGRIGASLLYSLYKNHAAEGGQVPVSSTMFGRTLSARGIQTDKRGGLKFRVGVSLRSS